MTRAKNGKSWWRRILSTHDADKFGTALTRRGVRFKASWHSPEQVERDRRIDKLQEESFRAFKDGWNQPPPPPITLDPNRDRSSGRPSYAEFRREDLRQD